MSQLVQMTHHMTSWLGLTPASPCDNLATQDADGEVLQESSGFVTVLVLYFVITAFFAAHNLWTSSAGDLEKTRVKRGLVAMERRQVQRHRVRSAGSLRLPCWLVKLPSLIRGVISPNRPLILNQRMRLRRKKEQELKSEKRLPALEEQDPSTPWQDAIDEEMAMSNSLVPQPQRSTFFDIPSESELNKSSQPN
ncbi:uncharacterized protein LOC108095569 [Drosophila ficusphila]|uniref:uncharacterized protein LOC108095569 n=1 Tax=Drosophila ficusphila TaxID=30025 RepID=UPI0007E69264|nr:uncharacterized protein LOC108095569 [Drosophila ficusphila]